MWLQLKVAWRQINTLFGRATGGACWCLKGKEWEWEQAEGGKRAASRGGGGGGGEGNKREVEAGVEHNILPPNLTLFRFFTSVSS